MIRDFFKIKKKVHFLHIGKTGGTALVETLSPYSNEGYFKILFYEHNVTLKDIPKGEKYFFILRDPITRFVSGYYSRYRQGKPRYDVPWTREEEFFFTKFPTPNDLAIALSSENDKKDAIKAMNSIYHVKSSFFDWFGNEKYFLSRIEDLLFIGFQETLAEDFQTIKEKLGIDLAVQLVENDVLAHKTPSIFNKTLEDKAIANLQEWYSKDIQFYKLCKNHISKFL